MAVRLATGGEPKTPSRFTFTTHLSIDECLDRLRRSTSPRPLFRLGMPPTRVFYCKFAGHKVCLFTRRPGQRRTMPFLHVTLREAPEGTVVDGRLGPHRIDSVLMPLGVAVVLGLSALMVWGILRASVASGLQRALGVLGPLGAAGFSILAALSSVAFDPVQEAELLRFIRTTLEAEQES